MKCLGCYRELPAGHVGEYHPACSRRFFGTPKPPELPYTQPQLEELAQEMVRQRVTVPGVQPKLSLEPDRTGGKARLTIVGLWGRYILKPATKDFPHLPANEDLTMHLAQVSGIPVVPHTLARLADGALVYLARRIDRPAPGVRIHQEDFCQLAGRLTEDKYNSSLEQVAKLLLMYSANPGVDAVRLWRLVLFCFLTGNADMHLKNFSVQHLSTGIQLAPAYDLVNTHLALPLDKEESALTLNAKKRKLNRTDFHMLANRLGIIPAVQQKMLNKLQEAFGSWEAQIKSSFLPQNDQIQYLAMIQEKSRKIF